MRFVAIVMVLPTAPAHAAGGNASTSAGTASGTVIAPIVLAHTSGASLNFGSFTAGTGGTLVVSTTGTASSTGAVTIVSGGTPSADAFTVTGDVSRAFAVTASPGTVTSGSNSMAFTAAPSIATGTTSTAGAATFTVGGTLIVPSAAATGKYVGTYPVTVTYN